MASLSNDAHNSEQGTRSATPRVLARNIIPTITKGLDASDVLECYALVRSVPLHGMANATLHIQKAALGFRYRPPGGLGTAVAKKPIEITLEYGPQRVGTMLDHDAMPVVQVEDISAFLSWDNVGRVYYTTKIVSDNYLSSYYMASMTGTVLGKMLGKAVDYSENKRRYQPFAVYSGENEKALKSSSSQDFTSYIWKELATLGVEIEPILSPPIYEARLWASAVNKISPEGQVAQDAALFYSRLYECMTAIATNDYSGFMPTSQPSISASPTFSPTQSGSPSQSPNAADLSDSAELPNSDAETTIGESNATESNGNDMETIEPLNGENYDNEAPVDEDNDDDSNRRDQSRRRLGGEEAPSENLDDTDDNVDDEDEEVYLNADEDEDKVDDFYQGDDFIDDTIEELPDESPDDEIGIDSAAPTSSPSISAPPTTSAEPTSEQDDPDGDAEKAQQAADEAKKAADVAKDAAETDVENKAADAAQAAADAAKKAADATTKAAAQATADAILSGDGDAMVSVITSNCLTNPQYGIAELNDDGNLTSQAYLYRDGSLYWHLDLVPPYFTIEKVNRPLPKAADLSNGGDGGDFLDWTLAFLVMGMILVGIVMIVQQMNIKLFDRLYFFQRWFFNPTNHDYEGDMLFTDSIEIGEDRVPISMGGRRTLAASRYRDSPSRDSSRHTSDSSESSSEHDNARGDVELCEIPGGRKTGRSSGGSCVSPNGSDPSIEYARSRSSSFDDDTSSSIPKRLLKNPNLVDFPSLSSSSKVATPVGLPKDGNGKSKGSDLCTRLHDEGLTGGNS